MEKIFSQPAHSIFKLPILILFPVLTGCAALHAQVAPTDFVITVKTDIGDPAGADLVAFYIWGTCDLYYESIPAGISGTWSVEPGVYGAQFPQPGTYRLAFKPKGTNPFYGVVPVDEEVYEMNFTNKILSVEQWGTVQWGSFNSAFLNCANLTISATDAPILTNVTDMRGMFAGCTSLTSVPGIENWEVGNVQDMGALFQECVYFNQLLGDWDVSNVENMFSMFFGATAFNQPLDNWEVGNVTNFGGMFYSASSFNQPLGSWDTGSATDMNSMFAGATSFDQALNNWDVSNLVSAQYMFYEASAFNQPLNNWDVRNVTNMAYMFYNASSFNQSLGSWTLNNAVSLDNLYTGSAVDCSSYSQTLIGWAENDETPAGRSLTVPGFSYGPAAADARDFLVSTMGWTISGDEFDGACTVLPVTLVSFEATVLESSTVLTWSTSEESNSDRFEVERSADAGNWSPIGVVAAIGESKTAINYRFQDHRPLNGINYYRLKMIDRAADRTEGKFVFSQIQSVDFESGLPVAVYPNPASYRLLVRDHKQVESIIFFSTAG